MSEGCEKKFLTVLNLRVVGKYSGFLLFGRSFLVSPVETFAARALGNILFLAVNVIVKTHRTFP